MFCFKKIYLFHKFIYKFYHIYITNSIIELLLDAIFKENEKYLELSFQR